MSKLPKSFGFVTGIQFKDSSLLISGKNKEKIVEKMTIVVHIGLGGIDNKHATAADDKQVGMVVSDTLLVTEVGGPDSGRITVCAYCRMARQS